MVLCKINDSFKFLETAILASQNLLTWFLCWLEITIHDEITVIMYRHYFSYFITIKKLLFVPRQKYYLYLEKWHIVACVCSPLCHHLYTIFHVVAWVCSFVSKHLQASLHGFDPHSLLLLFVLHPHAIIIFRMTILISNLPCLAARFFPREDCSICPLVPLFAYLQSDIALSARISAPSFAGYPRCAFTLTKKVADNDNLLFLLQSSFVVPRWLLPEHPRQVPPPSLPFHLHQSTCWLPSTMTGCHTNTATALLSACHGAPVKTLPIQANLSWSPLPVVLLCTAAFSFSFSDYYILLPIFLFCPNRHLSLLGSEPHSLQACLSPCSSSNCVLSH